MAEDKVKRKEDKPLNIKIFIYVAIIIFILSLIPYLINFYDNQWSNVSADWGTFGDYMGGTLNPMLAFLSLIALLKTIQIQSNELKASREELELTREELSRTANIQEKQSASINLQNFENTFFNMLNLHNQILESIRITHNPRYYLNYNHNYNQVEIKQYIHGDQRDKIVNKKLEKREVLNYISFLIDDFISKNELNKYRKFSKTYDIIYQSQYDFILGHYFRNIYQVLKLISNQQEIKDKKKYSNLFRAQFSSDEMQLLFYHCSGKFGSDKFKKLIEEFEFFEHLKIINIKTYDYILYSDIYDIKAFGQKEGIRKIIKEKKEKLEEQKKKALKFEEDSDYIRVLYHSNKFTEAKNEIIKKIEQIQEKLNNKGTISERGKSLEKERQMLQILHEEIKEDEILT